MLVVARVGRLLDKYEVACRQRGSGLARCQRRVEEIRDRPGERARRLAELCRTVWPAAGLWLTMVAAFGSRSGGRARRCKLVAMIGVYDHGPRSCQGASGRGLTGTKP